MTRRAAVEALARWALCATALPTSLYALLCNVPFIWKEFIECGIYPGWLEIFIGAHSFLCALIASLCAAVLWTNRASGKTGKIAASGAFAAAAALAAVPLVHASGLGGLQPGRAGLAAAFIAWLPVLAFEAAICRGRKPAGSFFSRGSESEVLGVFVAAGLLAFLFFSGAAAVVEGRRLMLEPLKTCVGLCWSLFLHELLAVGVFCAFSLVREIGKKLSGEGSEGLWFYGLMWAALTVVLRRIVLLKFPLEPLPAWSYCAVVAAGLTLTWRGQTGFGSGRSEKPSLAGSLLCLAALAAVRPAIAYDWDHILQNMWTIGAWAAVVSFLTALSRRLPAAPGSPWRFVAVFLGLLGLSGFSSGIVRADLARRGAAVPVALAWWQEIEPSFRCVRLLLALEGPDSFYAYLRGRANLSPDLMRAGPEFRVEGRWGPGLKVKPDIYVFLIDSLRRDYLGVYNPAVRFTPHLDAFARESFVMRRAFTNYGGTALSVPAFWAGALLPHMRYPRPFSRLNMLARLLEREHYRRYAATDDILRSILDPSEPWTRLDAKTDVNYKLCDSLAEIARVGSGNASQPLFAYSLPQDVHISSMRRERDVPALERKYPGFDPLAASRIENLDRCFGDFVRRLKRDGRYERSVIIVSTDHGDSMGEQGQWGHATSLRPEVVRIPLLIHVPAAYRSRRRLDEDRTAFLIDVVPTLYELLGHPLVRRREAQGRSLWGDPGADQSREPGLTRLLASSYGPVFGLIKGNGEFLYIADALNSSSHYFDLNGDPHGKTNLTSDSVETDNNALIRAHLEQLYRFYRIAPAP